MTFNPIHHDEIIGRRDKAADVPARGEVFNLGDTVWPRTRLEAAHIGVPHCRMMIVRHLGTDGTCIVMPDAMDAEKFACDITLVTHARPAEAYDGIGEAAQNGRQYDHPLWPEYEPAKIGPHQAEYEKRFGLEAGTTKNQGRY